MNTFKSTVVLATLLGVGYGVHVVLNKPLPGEPDGTQNVDEWPPIDLQGLSQSRPDVLGGSGSSLPAFEPGMTGTSIADGTETAIGNAADSSSVATADYASPSHPNNAVAHVSSSQPTVRSDMTSIAESGLRSPNASQQPSDAQFATNVNGQGNANPSAAVTNPVAEANEAAFEQIWQSAQTKLASSQYADALFALSLWYSEPGLTSNQRSRLIPMLDQLAGTVIYSQEHHLEQPYTVQQGDTLAQIANNYQVSTEFLSRINGLPNTNVPTTGQQLKVVRGPFRAELSPSQREITIFLGRYYAGRFSVGVGRDLPAAEMSLEVAEIAGARPYVDPQTNQQIPAGDPSNPYGDHWIGLRGPGPSVDPRLAIHSTGQGVDASDTRGCISLSAQDADDLQAIMAVGSKFTVLR